MRLASFFALLPLALCSLAGCRFGEARFETSFAGVGFDPGGTVFAWLDERDSQGVEDRDPRVVVAMTWVVFDPQSDLNDLDGASLSAMSHEMAVRDTLVLVFNNQGGVDDGETFRGVRQGDVVDPDGDAESDGFDARVHLAPERLSAASTFQDLEPFASRKETKVEIDAADFAESAAFVSGQVTIEFKAVAGSDPGNAREGDIEGDFRAPLVDEVIAEANVALLDDDGILGLPLADRPGAP